MTITLSLQNETLGRVERFIAARGISDATFGCYAVNDATFVRRLRQGRVTFQLAQRALDYVARQERAGGSPEAANGAGPGPAPAGESSGDRAASERAVSSKNPDSTVLDRQSNNAGDAAPSPEMKVA